MAKEAPPPDWERGIATGMTEARRHLDAIRLQRANTDRVVRAYASGIAVGTMRWMLKKYGSHATYDLFIGLADEALDAGADIIKGD